MLAPHRSELYFKRTKTYRTTKDWGVGVVKTPATERCTECVMPDARGTGRGVTKQEIGESGDEIKRMGDKRAGRADGPPRVLLVLRCSNQNVEMVNQKCKHGRRRRSKCKDVASASSSFTAKKPCPIQLDPVPLNWTHWTVT